MSLERSALKVIPVDQWVDKGRRPPKGIAVHNRLAKAANPDTPFHRVLILQEQLRAKSLQEKLEKEREEAAEKARVEGVKQAEEQQRILDRMVYLQDGMDEWNYNRRGSVETPEQYAEFKFELDLWNWKMYPELRFLRTAELFAYRAQLASSVRYYLEIDKVETPEGGKASRISQIKHSVFTAEGLDEFDKYLSLRGRRL